MKRTGASAAGIRNIEPSTAHRGNLRADLGYRAGRAMLHAAFALTALLGLAALLAGCPFCGGDDIPCEDGFSISGAIDLAANAPAHIEVRACRNGSCGSATVSAEPPPSPSKAGTLGSAGVGVDGGSFGFMLWDVDRTNTQWEVSIHFSPGLDTELEDGDVYAISIINAVTQRELVSFEGRIAYKEIEPDICTTCYFADFKLPPPAAP